MEQFQSYEDQIKIKPHAFVVMPFGKKEGFDGQILDFNAIYTQLIKPALIEAGFEPFRADEETRSGDILTDMFQELLLADLVICDMSIDNANVFYELGIRHAFQRRGVVHIQSGRAYMPFDIFNVRTIPYHTNADGIPDPDYLEKDIQTIARVARDTWNSDKDAIHSPIYNLLPGLDEPDRKSLRTPLATGFWRDYDKWRDLVTIARRRKRIGDILLLTEEITNPLIKEEAYGEAGRALNHMSRHELALQQYRKGLGINNTNLEFRRKEAMHLNRLDRVDEAIVRLEKLLEDVPDDSEAISYLGRIYKDMWMDSWKGIEDQDKRILAAFEAYHWLLKSVNTYLHGYRHDLNNYYPGVNALTLAMILVNLADRFDDADDPDPEITEIRNLIPNLRTTLTFALENLVTNEKTDYWTLVSLAELRVTCVDNKRKVERAYRKSFTAARKNQFFLQSSRQQLIILQSLGIRDAYVQVGLDAIDDEMRRISRKEETEESVDDPAPLDMEKRVFLFAGYMVDMPGQIHTRFLESQSEALKESIEELLSKHRADSNDLVFLSGLSAGSEIIFAESCVARKMQVEVHLPQTEAKYLSQFVAPAGDAWVERYYLLRNNPDVNVLLQSEYIGEAKPGLNIYERNNRWAIYGSLLEGIDKVRLIALWDGKVERPADLNGQLVLHMVEQMRNLGGRVDQINSARFIDSSMAVTTVAQPTDNKDLAAPTPSTNSKARKKQTA